MTTPTDTDIPPCPDATLWEFTTYRADRRTKTGWRLVEEYTMNYPDERDALHHAQEVESLTGSRVEYRKYWVLKYGFMPPHKPFWESWRVPHACSAASETYWSS
jgi:hypothetical protein